MSGNTQTRRTRFRIACIARILAITPLLCGWELAQAESLTCRSVGYEIAESTVDGIKFTESKDPIDIKQGFDKFTLQWDSKRAVATYRLTIGGEAVESKDPYDVMKDSNTELVLFTTTSPREEADDMLNSTHIAAQIVFFKRLGIGYRQTTYAVYGIESAKTYRAERERFSCR